MSTPTGEFKGVREARDRLRQQWRESGFNGPEADRKADQAVRRLDHNIRTGKVRLPKD